MAKTTLEQLFVEELCDVYDAEQQITKALPKMMEAASSNKLKSGFEQHLQETERQIERLDQIFSSLELEREEVKCEALAGLVTETEEIMKIVDQPEVLDAALIISAQKVEHYEIATYGSLRALAECLGHDDAAKLLSETLDEESATDEKLTQMAKEVNDKARDISEEAE